MGLGGVGAEIFSPWWGLNEGNEHQNQWENVSHILVALKVEGRFLFMGCRKMIIAAYCFLFYFMKDFEPTLFTTLGLTLSCL